MVMLRSRRAIRLSTHHGLLLWLLLTLALGNAPLALAQQQAAHGNCTHPDPATRPDCPEAIAFLAKFQDALKSNDRKAVAPLVSYPLLVTGAPGRMQVRSRAQLLSGFDGIFTTTVRSAILKATPDDVWGNSRGFMIGDGAIWFDAVIPMKLAGHPTAAGAKYPFKLITVNRTSP
jgi:hypothetical protein